MVDENQLKEILKKHWGYDSYRPLQCDVILNAVQGNDGLVIMPTGGGKSLCYQVPSALKQGMVIVVSPLIALMDDQVASARESGLNAIALHSNLSPEQKREAYRMIDARSANLIYVSPERLSVGDLLPKIADSLSLITIDEAHCISHWGHDFRPEYRQLHSYLEPYRHIPLMALTATATPQVQDDICQLLKLKGDKRFVGHVDRPNLIFRSVPRKKLVPQIMEVIDRHPGEGGIVYCQTRSTVERTAEKLKAMGVSVAGYHAGMSAKVRAQVQEDFIKEKIDVIVATIAFGMGIDRSNVRYVVHANVPKSIEHYQQESGRAGRDGLEAECVMLFNYSDIVTHRHLAENEGYLSAQRRNVLEMHLKGISRYAHSPICRHRLLTEHFGQQYPPEGVEVQASCGACDVCLGETKCLPEEEALIMAQKIISGVYRCNNRFGVGHVIDVLRGKDNEKIRRNGHDRLSTYALLKEYDDGRLRTWFDQLIMQGALLIDQSDGYPLVQATTYGIEICKQGGKVHLSFIEESKKSSGKRGRGGTEADWEGVDEALFKSLKALRKAIADHKNKPPYVIFSDDSLRELARHKPNSRVSFLNIKGVGEYKMKHYGEMFLKVIAGASSDDVLNEHNIRPMEMING